MERKTMFWRRDPGPSTDRLYVDRVTESWYRTCEALGLTHDVDTVTGTTHVVPRVEHVTIGPPTRLTVRLVPGMLPADISKAGPRLARSMGAFAIRVEPRGFTHALVELMPCDPLADTIPLPGGPITGPILLGVDEQGRDVSVADMPHTIAAGQTGSGKSLFAYSLLSQVAERIRAGEPCRITGIDPSSVTLRPFPDAVLGLQDPARIERKLAGLVRELDDRLSAIPHDRDTLPVSHAHPWTLVVLEEWPAVLRALDVGDKKLANTVRSHVSRLLAEARKVRISVFILAQRPEANIIGGAERAQLGLRLSFRLDGPESVKLLHPEADPAVAAEHSTALPGVALLSTAGHPLQRIRAPFVPYSEFARRTAA
jgi:S-DNA-T family DNA segregation ATPase FtsK/SpoIIIE